MASHHFIGNGRVTTALVTAVGRPDQLAETLTAKIQAAGLAVVDTRCVGFDKGGLTLVFVLAESHLVLHYWAEEGFATIDLHVCDYQGSNAAKAASLITSLTNFFFQAGTETWNEVHLDGPGAARPGARVDDASS